MKTLISAILFAFSCAAHAAPALHSAHAVVYDASSKTVLLDKNGNAPAPIASITKVMTAMVALDAKQNLEEQLQVAYDDVDTFKNSSSRVAVGTQLSREEMLHLALMSSENRAAHALSRYYPGGNDAFVDAMNRKAKSIGMRSTHLEDPTGLSPANHASAHDLVRLVLAAERYSPITQFTTTASAMVPVGSRLLKYKNSNPLVGKPNWDIELSKTGYTREAGRCIVMKLEAAGRDLVVVLLGSKSAQARLADIQAIKRWITGEPAETVVAQRGARRQAAKASGYRSAYLSAKNRTNGKASMVKSIKRDSKAAASKSSAVAAKRPMKHTAKVAKQSAKSLRLVKHTEVRAKARRPQS